ncbi:hypothetical protein JOL79_04375 [Microbispora sp. RL4-1S]|uniref:Uncharacterized protein n=1 Tax=Microbispora oryzae TaxID=2806554 RepID=A0A940WCQ1_9ACTN|nr:hypothetical protein [Microbispora oryzae]MBP2703036.1 hypothetical protein [Microbispora oryzae]
MPDKPLTPAQTAALIILMVEAGEVTNPELAERWGHTLTGKDRTQLNDLKLVESKKVGRSYAHMLTDAGWARAAEEFRDGVNAPKGSVGGALRALVFGVHRFIRRTDQTLAEVFARDEDVRDGTATPGEVPGKPRTVPGAGTSQDPETRPDTGADTNTGTDLETRIRDAYRRLASAPNAWVGLASLRASLGGAGRREVDDALRLMIAMPGVRIVPFDNQKALTPDDHDAAVVIGDQARHLIMIGA